MASAPFETVTHGHCDRAFGRVQEAFRENFTQRGELGAACCVYLEGEPVVDLWGGWADEERSRPWQRDTLVGFYSVGKLMVTVCALHLCETAEVPLDDPVARWWPEFGTAGKERITLRQVLCHQAGLPAVRTPLPDNAMFDWDLITASLARERPWWEPGTAHGYHANTFGFLVGEVVRRVSGLSLGHYLQKHIAGPLGADLAIGLQDRDLARVAELFWPAAGGVPAALGSLQDTPEYARMWLYTYMNPPGLSSLGVLNTGAWRQAEVPSANGHGTARGLARVAAALAAGGTLEGVQIVHPALLREATRPHSEGLDKVLRRPTRFGLGFQLTQPERPLGPHAGAFGHFGNGGSLCFADPEAKIGFGYVLNHIVRNWRSPRNDALLAALYHCL